MHDLNLVSMLEYEMQPVDKKLIRLSALARQVVSEFLNNGLDEQNGHGLGLPMVARIAGAHQGCLNLYSDTGKGFIAEIILPSINSDQHKY